MTLPAHSPLHSKLTLRFTLGVVAGALLIEFLVSASALLTTLIDALAALFIFAPATLLGIALLRLFRLPPMPTRWTLLFGAVLGLGLLSLLVLLGGVLGILQRPVWVAVLAGSAVLGIPALRNVRSKDQCKADWRLLLPWLAAIPFLVLALLAASNPPGLIWREEGFGYDVLEYHLQLPREYLQAGAITYLPHNVYANFPAGVEMLYLLAMIVQNNTTDVGTSANMIHLGFAALSVAAAWAIGRDTSPRAGIVCGLSLATCTWLEYLSGLAYVENAMLFFALCATAALLQSAGADQRATIGPWAALAGVCAGFSGACKYTAVAMLIAPLAVMILVLHERTRRAIAAVGVFCLAALVALSPWLIKNYAWTGNPVFPLANRYFEANPSGWSPQQTAQWDRAHAPQPELGVADRLTGFWHKVPADPEQRFGPAIWIVGLAGLLIGSRDRSLFALFIFLALQICVWLFATHLYSRFAVPMIVPLAVLAGLTINPMPNGRNLVVLGLVIAGSVWNLAFAISRHARESLPGAPTSLFEKGELPGFEYLGYVNEKLPASSRLLMIGDARPYYVMPPADYFVTFNHNPFLAMIADGAPAQDVVEWLRDSGYTHVLVHWGEIRRLERTYGLSPSVPEGTIAAAVVEMKDAGLLLAKSFVHPAGESGTYVDVYQVLSARGRD